MLRRKETAVPRPAAPSSTSSELTYLEMAFARVPMFSACSVDELVRIAQVATVRDVSEGTDVIREGEPGEEFFVILRGGARISRGVLFASPEGVSLTLDIYRPTASGVYPAIVQIYGGAWQRGAPGDEPDERQ